MLLQQKQVSGLLASLQQLQTNIDGKTNMAAVQTAINSAISALVDGAPTALDTLKELALKLQSEESALNALVAVVDTKASKTYVDGLISTINASISSLQTAVSVVDAKAVKAQTDATQALTNAATADAKAVKAQTDATKALSDAAIADGKAVKAQTDATKALSDAATANSKAVTAQTRADQAFDNSNVILSQVTFKGNSSNGSQVQIGIMPEDARGVIGYTINGLTYFNKMKKVDDGSENRELASVYLASFENRSYEGDAETIGSEIISAGMQVWFDPTCVGFDLIETDVITILYNTNNTLV